MTAQKLFCWMILGLGGLSACQQTPGGVYVDALTEIPALAGGKVSSNGGTSGLGGSVAMGGRDAPPEGGRAAAGDSSGGRPTTGGAMAMTSRGGSLGAGETGQPRGGVAGSTSLATGGTSNEPTAPAALVFCRRLDNVSTLSANVTTQFMDRMLNDCAVGLLWEEYFTSIDVLANRILKWNLPLWGCTEPAPTTFNLVSDSIELSRGDVAILIDHYMQSAQDVLRLSGAEARDLRAMLVYLAEERVVSASTEPSRPVDCQSMGSGGEPQGGAGGGAGEPDDASGGTDR